MSRHAGFTLVELLVVMGIVGILLMITLVALNPEKQFRSAREAKRMADAQVLLDAVSQYFADNKTKSIIPADNLSRYIAQGTYKSRWSLTAKPVTEPNINLCALLVPTYMANVPTDPLFETEASGCSNYDTGYMITVTLAGRIIISAPFSEVQPIVLTR